MSRETDGLELIFLPDENERNGFQFLDNLKIKLNKKSFSLSRQKYIILFRFLRWNSRSCLLRSLRRRVL